MTTPIQTKTPWERAIYQPMPRSHAVADLANMEEIDLEKAIDEAFEREEERKLAEANFRFHADVRSKMFKNVLGNPKPKGHK
jgi:hypothetical protein